MTTVYLDRMATPIGQLLLAHAGEQLCLLDFEDYETRFRTVLARRFGNLPHVEEPMPSSMREAVEAYFNGVLNALDSIPVHTAGTSFQQMVWGMLRRIPPGETWSYAQLAMAIGHPGASRAVGTAIARNPIALIIPCHRVLDSQGRLAGYSGGTERKRWLLRHEGAFWREAPLKVPTSLAADTAEE